ncbi:efflux RND transporter permease subunit [Candidatus Obscuribacterales bacterium]|nr:efflux RND transporter permease subunit [Candidatus Obscuribacterales bacterium]
MSLTDRAMERPITVIVAVLTVALCSILALTRMKIDIFPDLNLPVIYVAQPYGGMSPSQMEGYLVNYYEYHFLYITGIEHVESKSIQGTGLIKLVFHPGTDMSQALAQTISYVERSRAFMPPGTVSPFVVRFDAGTVPVGYLVFSSDSRNLGEIQDLALFKVRPAFATLPGVSSPPPFGGNQRAIVVSVNPEKLRSYHMSPDEVVQAISSGNVIIPAGNVRTGDLNRITPINSVVGDIKDLLEIPLRQAAGPTVYLRDVGTVKDSTDILSCYALIDGKRSVYIPVTKRADASTVDVVNRVKEQLPKFRALIPEDIKIKFEFDQSTYVKDSILGLVMEGALGALLTGLMVLLFLRDWRSALIVVVTIPFALLSATVALWLTGQTINIMTLGGLALAVGILVDEATVSIENIHTHLERGQPLALAVLEASQETLTPRLLAMISVIAVFAPSFLMVGSTRALFVPLSLAVGFSMLASFLLSSTLVPVLSTWLMRKHVVQKKEKTFVQRMQDSYARIVARSISLRWIVAICYLAVTALAIALIYPQLGRELFPTVDTGQFQVRLRAPTGTRVERTEVLTLKLLDLINQTAGPNNVEISLAFVGTVPSSYPINTIYLWTSGPQEAVLRVALRPHSEIRIAELKERLRKTIAESMPTVRVSFEAGDIVSQVMNFGAPTPIEVAINGPNFEADKQFAAMVLAELQKVPSLRDLQYSQPQDYPTVDVAIDRQRSGQLGVSVNQIGRSLLAATSSSRFFVPNYWADSKTGVGYQVQVEIPQSTMNSVEEVKRVPAMTNGNLHPLVGDVAQVKYGVMPGEIDRYNMQRMITISANVAGEDLGRAAKQVQAAIDRAGQPPRGVSVTVRGQIPPMQDAFSALFAGLGVAVLAIFLLLSANFQSMRLAFVVLSAVPAVISGVVLALFVTSTTLNIQSFIGAIMAIGVGVANTILLVTFAENARMGGKSATEAAADGATSRLRPILMTSMAMVAGMVPMAMALAEGGDQTAPLGRAVIGGLIASTIAVLIVVPSIFALVQGKANRKSSSIHPRELATNTEGVQ